MPDGDFMKIVAMLFVLVGLFSMAVYARPNPDEVGVCYLFKGNELKDRDVCVVVQGSGAGGMYTNLYFKGKEYLFEYSNDDIDEITYPRDVFYNFLEPERVDIVEPDEIIWCHKNKPYDVCYRAP